MLQVFFLFNFPPSFYLKSHDRTRTRDSLCQCGVTRAGQHRGGRYISLTPSPWTPHDGLPKWTASMDSQMVYLDGLLNKLPRKKNRKKHYPLVVCFGSREHANSKPHFSLITVFSKFVDDSLPGVLDADAFEEGNP